MVNGLTTRQHEIVEPRRSQRPMLRFPVILWLRLLRGRPLGLYLDRKLNVRTDCICQYLWKCLACCIMQHLRVNFGLFIHSFTLYHSIQLAKAKRVLRTLDHSTIFLLIAGTYTPFTLVNLRGPWGWSLFGVIWALAVIGILFQTTMLRKGAIVSIAFCVAMGWVVVIAIKPMLSLVDTGGLVLLLLGGVAYTTGVVFYVWRQMPYNHAIWHVFVLAGSALHFFAILLYVIPLSPPLII